MQNQVSLETYPIKCSLGIAKLILVDSVDSPGVSVYGCLGMGCSKVTQLKKLILEMLYVLVNRHGLLP